MSTTIDEKRMSVIQQFFDQYLEPFFLREISKVPEDCHLAKSMLLFAALDFYGKIFRVGQFGFPLTKKGDRNYSDFNNSEANFEEFVKMFFPSHHSCKGVILYRVFRCGVMHQIVPKGAGLNYASGNNEMFYIEQLSNGQIIPVLNLFHFEQIVKSAIYEFKIYLLNDANYKDVARIYEDLIVYPDAFGDFQKLDDSVSLTPNILSVIDYCKD